jgi:hypothetical protein
MFSVVRILVLIACAYAGSTVAGMHSAAPLDSAAGLQP